MQYRGVYKEECSMKKVCASLFLIILLVTRAQSTDCTKTRCGEDAWFCENVESWTVCLTSGGNRALMAASIDNHEIR